jgi:hypothetical protein
MINLSEVKIQWDQFVTSQLPQKFRHWLQFVHVFCRSSISRISFS